MKSVWDDPENRKYERIVLDPNASLEDILQYAILELFECMDSLPPSAEHKERRVDGFHASCCALRAASAINLVKRKLKPK